MEPTSVMLIPVLCGPRFLLHLRDDLPNVVHRNEWAGFGGYIEPGESPEIAVLRELCEETSLERIANLQRLATFTDREGRGDVVQTFIGDGPDLNLIHLQEGSGFGVFGIEAIGTLSIVPYVRSAIELYIERAGRDVTRRSPCEA